MSDPVKITSTDYGRQIFWMAWGTRLLFMAAIVMVAELTWDRPFYVGAVDATRYHRVASEISQLLAAGNFQQVFPHLAGEYLEHTDNYGVPFVLGFVYTFTGSSVIVAKVFMTLMGAGTAFFSYKTAKLITDESTARLAGILIAFFPLSLFYSSVILKEEFVVFLSMVGIFLLTKSVVKGRIKLWELAVLISSVSILFLFRTAAGALMVSLVVGIYFMNRIKGSVLISLSMSTIIILGFFYFIDAFGEVDYYVERVSGVFDYSEARIRSIAQENTMASIVGIPTFVVLSFIAPFPSMVYLPLGNPST
ncbi:MAG: glycosyltransferase family 39 protein [Balneolaceae bacterium]|nr:glycosyltransferase family 39 protein [Balneolaceae bacterium]